MRVCSTNWRRCQILRVFLWSVFLHRQRLSGLRRKLHIKNPLAKSSWRLFQAIFFCCTVAQFYISQSVINWNARRHRFGGRHQPTNWTDFRIKNCEAVNPWPIRRPNTQPFLISQIHLSVFCTRNLNLTMTLRQSDWLSLSFIRQKMTELFIKR